MKTKLATLLIVGLNSWCLVAFGQADQAKPAVVVVTEDTSGEFSTDEAPLTAVIELLARLAELNILIDPKVTSGVGPDGKPTPVPLVPKLRFKGVTAEQALEAVLANHNLVLVRDPKTKSARVTVKDPNAQEPLLVQVRQLRYGNPTNLALMVKSTLSARSQVIPDSRTSQLVVLATAKEFEGLDELIEKLDAPTRQVLIEARLLETTRAPSSVKGIDWSGTLTAQQFTWGNGVTSSETTTKTPGDPVSTTLPSGRVVTSSSDSSTLTTTKSIIDPLAGIIGMGANSARGWHPETAFLNADGVSAVLSFLNSDADTEVVATPRAVTLDNEEARLEVTRSFPIFQQNPGSAQTPATTQIIYTNVGTILRVTPRISANNNIAMRVTPEVSNIDSKDRQVVNGEINEANVYATRKISTHVLIPSGNTLVMGGLVSDSATKTYNKVPILGDLPGIGLAFRHEAKRRQKSNLLIFITPTIVQDADFMPAETSFLQTPVPMERPDEKETAWDSAKPHDWGKPVY